MRRVGRQAQLVNLLPSANTHVGWIELGTLLGQFLASLFGALLFFVREALGGSPDQVGCMGCHGSLKREFSVAAPCCEQSDTDRRRGSARRYRLHPFCGGGRSSRLRSWLLAVKDRGLPKCGSFTARLCRCARGAGRILGRLDLRARVGPARAGGPALLLLLLTRYSCQLPLLSGLMIVWLRHGVPLHGRIGCRQRSSP